jgi:hypothetical protein
VLPRYRPARRNRDDSSAVVHVYPRPGIAWRIALAAGLAPLGGVDVDVTVRYQATGGAPVGALTPAEHWLDLSAAGVRFNALG